MKTVLDREDLVFSPPGPGCVLSITGLPGSGSKVYDRSPYGKQATVTGVDWVRLPGGLWVLSFDGIDDSVSVSDWDNGLLGSDYAVEQWVNSDNLLVRGYAIGVASWSTGAFYIRTNSTTKKLEYGAYGGNEIVSGTALSEDAWYYIAVQVISGTAQFYLNGIADGSPNSGNTLSGSHTLHIGKGHGENEWSGLIGFTRLHCRALSVFEIRRHFEQERSLFGAW